MTTNNSLLDSLALRESFQVWREQEDSLDAQWQESLAALAAFQSHLDDWQQQLARERDELKLAQEEWERERAAQRELEQESDSETADVAALYEQIAQLTQELQARTEEVHGAERLRAEQSSELEQARARAEELAAAVDEHKRTLEHERVAWTEQLHHMRETLEGSSVGAMTGRQDQPATRSSDEGPSPLDSALPGQASEKRAASNPVLGSIVEQFGKLRRQRAMDRQINKKAR